MIGKPVTAYVLEKVLARQKEKSKYVEQMEEELKDIKRGECLLYEFRLDNVLWASMGLALLVNERKDLKAIKEENCVYVYREGG